MISAVRIAVIAIGLAQLTACCAKQQDLHDAALHYYTNDKDHINGMQYYVEEINVMNVRKYSCDSVTAYVRVKGDYIDSKPSADHKRHDFDKASSLIIVRRGSVYAVISEVEAE